MTTTGDIVAQWRDRITTIPPEQNDFVCSFCLGPVSPNYPRCYGCHKLVNEVPFELRDAVVPMTSALSPSPWYTALAQYKAFQPDKRAVLVSIVHHFLIAHADPIKDMLGGAPTVITVVPSKRGVSFTDQPLRQALAMVEPINSKLRETLQFISGSVLGRQEYDPSVFRAGPFKVKGQRVALIEDTYVTGATALSAAGQLLALGAGSVGLFPIARRVDSGYWHDPADPYRKAMLTPVNAESRAGEWPRGDKMSW